MDESAPGQSREEIGIVDLLEALNDDLGLTAGRPEPESEVRDYVELLGLLSREPEPVAPEAATKERLMAAIAAGPTAPGRGNPGRESRPEPAARAGSPRWNRRALPAAAGLAALLLGLSGWQISRLQAQDRTIAELSERLEAATLQSSQLVRMRRQLGETASTLGLVTASGTEVCNLRPVGDRPLQPESRGVLFVASDHQHWYLRIDGLSRSAEEGSYQLWFITGERGAVSGGTFEARSGAQIELASETMPDGTRAVSITLEPPGGSPSPSGPEILYGDEVMRIL